MHYEDKYNGLGNVFLHAYNKYFPPPPKKLYSVSQSLHHSITNNLGKVNALVLEAANKKHAMAIEQILIFRT